LPLGSVGYEAQLDTQGQRTGKPTSTASRENRADQAALPRHRNWPTSSSFSARIARAIRLAQPSNGGMLKPV
jgi:hypothetical protein